MIKTMKKISKKQLEEIEFLEKQFCKRTTTDTEREDYILKTVHGNHTGGGSVQALKQAEYNPLIIAKRKLDISCKMWREDLTIGLLGADELKEDLNCAFGNRLVDSLLASVTREYRLKKLTKHGGTILSFTNFPNVLKHIQQ